MACVTKNKPYCEKKKDDYSNCKVWFDGCNTCRVMKDNKLACTRKFCKVKKTAYCMEERPGIVEPKKYDVKSMGQTLKSTLFGFAVINYVVMV